MPRPADLDTQGQAGSLLGSGRSVRSGMKAAARLRDTSRPSLVSPVKGEMRYIQEVISGDFLFK